MKRKTKVIGILCTATIGITLLFFTNVNLAANTAKVNVDTANLRETADENSKILKQLSLNDNLEVVEETGDWYKVKNSNVTGYVRKDLVTVENKKENTNTSNTSNTQNSENTSIANTENKSEETTNEQIVVEDTKLKIVPTINSTDIIDVKKDEKVTVIETINGWVCVQKDNTKGWIRKDKLASKTDETTTNKEEANNQEESKTTETPIKTAYISETKVNVRKEADKNSEVVVKLTQNTSVEVYAEENGWSKIKVDGKEGYVSSDLLSDQKVEVTKTTNNTTTNTTNNKTNNTTKKNNVTSRSSTTVREEKQTTQAVSSGKGSTVVATAKNYIGSKYVYGATGPTSFDCSGFTSYVYKLHGISLNRTAQAQYSNGTSVSRGNLQPGDLIMFGSSASSINHVAIYIGNGNIVHAANPSRGVTIDSINSGYYDKNYVGARRIM